MTPNTLVSRRKGNTGNERQEERVENMESQEESSAQTGKFDNEVLLPDEDKKKRYVTYLKRINIFLGFIVIYLLLFFLAPVKKRNAYKKLQKKRLEAISSSLQSQKEQMGKNYEDLVKLINYQIGMVSNIHHEEEVEELKLNITLLEKENMELLHKDSKAIKEKNENIGKLSEDLNSKKKAIEKLEEELRRHKQELEEVKSNMVKNEVSSEYFCANCKFKNSEGKGRGNCEQHKKQLMKKKNFSEDIARLAVIQLSPTCLSNFNEVTELIEEGKGNIEDAATNEEKKESPQTEERGEKQALKILKDTKKFCSECRYNQGGISASCGERRDFITKSHKMPIEIAEESIMELDSNCIRIMKFCDTCEFKFPGTNHKIRCDGRLSYVLKKHPKMTEQEAMKEIVEQDSNCMSEIMFCAKCYYKFPNSDHSIPCESRLAYLTQQHKKSIFDSMIELMSDDPKCISELEFCYDCEFKFENSDHKSTCGARLSYLLEKYGKSKLEVIQDMKATNPTCMQVKK